MNSLDSPLEALAFNYLSVGFLTAINNAWTWAAVITAAVSYWRIRSSVTHAVKPSPPPPMVAPSPPPTKTEDKADQRTSTTSAPAEAAAAVVTAEIMEAAMKGKFTVYYEDEREEEEEAEEGCDGGFGEAVGGGGEDYWSESWGKMLRMRTGEEMGWYRYQDLTVLDGNVVRLWDGCCSSSSSSTTTTTPISFSSASTIVW